MKIGILITDAVREELISEHGDYPDMFEDLMAGVDGSVEFTRFYVQNKIPESVDCDGYLITGSRHSVYEDLSWIKELVNFIKHVLASRRKIIGVCFGHQLMAHYFGGLVEKSVKGWAVGVHKSDLVARQSWMDKADFREDVSLLSSHQDQVVRLPEEATLYATNEFCPIAGFVVGDQVLTIQGHPEFDKEYARALLHLRKDILGESVFEAGLASLERPTDQQVLARWFINFLQNPPEDFRSNKRLGRYFSQAEKVIQEEGRVHELIRKATEKIEKLGRKTFGDTWDEVLLVVEMIKSWAQGDYQDISKKSVIMMIAAIIYFVAPLDAVPDFLFGWGYLDDLAVLRLVFGQIKVEMEKFKDWKQQR